MHRICEIIPDDLYDNTKSYTIIFIKNGNVILKAKTSSKKSALKFYDLWLKNGKLPNIEKEN